MSDISFAKNVDQQNHLHIIVEGMYFYAKQATYRLCKKKVYLALFEKETCSLVEFTA